MKPDRRGFNEWNNLHPPSLFGSYHGRIGCVNADNLDSWGMKKPRADNPGALLDPGGSKGADQ
jgi:hypothetical protein